MDTGVPEGGDELTPALGKVARRALVQHGLVTYAAVARIRPADLLAIHGIGPKAIRILAEELATRGLAFPDA